MQISKVPYNKNKQPLYKLHILVQLGLGCFRKERTKIGKEY